MSDDLPRDRPRSVPWIVATASLGLVSAALATALVTRDPSTPAATPRSSRSPSPTAAATSPSPSPAVSSSPPAAPFDLVSLRDASVPAMCGRPAGRLTKGRLPGVDEGYTFMGTTRSADLDGDGVPEAVAQVDCSAGGNDAQSALLVYRTGPTLVGQVPVDDGLLEEFRLVDGTVEVVARLADKGDPRCCPSAIWVRRFGLAGSRIERRPAGQIDPAATLDASGWGSVTVGARYAELARATDRTIGVKSLDEPGDIDAFDCAYVSIFGDAPVTAMGGDGLVRAVVTGQSSLRTSYGTAVGDKLDRILQVHGRRVERVPNEYSPVPDVVVTEPSGLVLRYEFAGGKDVVSAVHAGERGWALLVEGCA